MNDKNKLLTNFLVYGFLIFFRVNTIIQISRIYIADQKNENLFSSAKDSPIRKPSIKERSDEIFNSKLKEAKIEGVSSLELSDGTITRKTESGGNLGIGKLVYFSAKIKYDDFAEQYQCRPNYQSVDPISKDIKIAAGSCTENVGSRKCTGKDRFDDYIQYRANDEKEIRLYKPEVVVEVRDMRAWSRTRYNYYKVLPYSLFKDFEKIALRYDTFYEWVEPKNKSKSTYTSKFDINSVLMINNLQRRCSLSR